MIYQVLIGTGKVAPGQGINQAQRNKIKITRLAFDKNVKPEVIFVGSSRMASIDVESVSPTYYNMGMFGDSSHTGLLVCQKLPRKPKTVVVEMSACFKQGLNHELLDKVFVEPWFSAYKAMPFARPEFQPVNVTLSAIRLKRGKAPVVLAREDLRQNMIKKFMVELIIPMDDKARNFYINEVDASKLIIDDLQKSGVRVVLMRMPHEPVTENTPVIVEMFKILLEKFPKDKYEWFEDSSTPWRTNDGMHLIDEDGQRLSKNIANYLAENKNAPLTK